MSERKPMPRVVAWIAWTVVLLIMWMAVAAMSSSWEDKFIAGYESWHGDVDAEWEARLIHGASLACGLLDEGNDLPDTYDALVDYGFSSDQATSVISGGVVYRCPEYAPLVQR